MEFVLAIVPALLKLCLVAAAICFIFMFFRPAFQVRRKLKLAIIALKKIPQNSTVDVGDIFSGSPTLDHLWKEYAETLHHQSKVDAETGQISTERIRSTVPSEVFFKSSVIIDTPLNSEFFKHLPGLCTGVGIIGTFFGLIVGLKSFIEGSRERTDSVQMMKAL